MPERMQQAMPVAMLHARDGFMPRPDPTRPDPSPSYSRPLTQIQTFEFSETTDPTLNASQLRRARVTVEFCWACDARTDAPYRTCWNCSAPRWTGEISYDAPDTPGVYVIGSDCGLAKVGISRCSIERRTTALIYQARSAGVRCWLAVALRGAEGVHERWLHSALCESRDPLAARDWCLPNPTEWFWPTSALQGLVDGQDFAHLTRFQEEEIAA